MIDDIKKDFPFFKAHPSLVYLDNAATTQKPQAVIDAISDFYTTKNAPIHRGIYTVAEQATALYEQARVQVANFIHAADSSEIIFTHGATHALNMVAQGWGNACVQEDDEVVVTELEHHSNFIPWQHLCQQKKALLKIIPVTEQGVLDYSNLDAYITKKTKMVAVTQVSNALGTLVDLKPLIQKAHAVGARVLVDGCQAVPYQPVDVQLLGCDFYVFSGHKMMGPVGIGVLYARKEAHAAFMPATLGGGMVREVSRDQCSFLKAPHCYEAGTPSSAQVVGLSAALIYLQQYDAQALQKHIYRLNEYLVQELQNMPRIRILGPVDQLKRQGHLVSFVVDGMHAHDVVAYLDQYNICVRAGNHCAQILSKRLNYDASVRVSLYAYNTERDTEYCIQILKQLCS